MAAGGGGGAGGADGGGGEAGGEQDGGIKGFALWLAQIFRLNEHVHLLLYGRRWVRVE